MIVKLNVVDVRSEYWQIVHHDGEEAFSSFQDGGRV